MSIVSQLDIFSVDNHSFDYMIEVSANNHFWVIGSNVTMIPERSVVQRTLPHELRLFRDSSSNTVAGVLMNKDQSKFDLQQFSFTDSTFKGSTFMNIEKEQPLDVVLVGGNSSYDWDLPNMAIEVKQSALLDDIADFVSTDYFFLVPSNFEISEYFMFDARVTDVLDCHYNYMGELNGNVTPKHSIKLLNKNLITKKPSKFLRYGGFLDLPHFSGTAVM